MDWQSFLAVEFWALVTLAATLSTAVSTAVTLLVRWRSRPEADWAVVPLGTEPPNEYEPRAALAGRVINAGDGPAFRVRVRGYLCDPYLSELVDGALGPYRADVPYVALINIGAEVRVRLYCAPDDWERARLLISWTPSPVRRRKRRSAWVPLHEVAPKPEPGD